MREREKERLRRWRSQLKRYTAKGTEAAKKKCAELRKKIRDAEMRMKMRDMKLRMMKKTEKSAISFTFAISKNFAIKMTLLLFQHRVKTLQLKPRLKIVRKTFYRRS